MACNDTQEKPVAKRETGRIVEQENKKMSTDEPMVEEVSTKEQSGKQRAIDILNEAISGQRSKSKNGLIKDAIKALGE